jgi:hypothetical protein
MVRLAAEWVQPYLRSTHWRGRVGDIPIKRGRASAAVGIEDHHVEPSLRAFLAVTTWVVIHT